MNPILTVFILIIVIAFIVFFLYMAYYKIPNMINGFRMKNYIVPEGTKRILTTEPLYHLLTEQEIVTYRNKNYKMLWVAFAILGAMPLLICASVGEIVAGIPLVLLSGVGIYIYYLIDKSRYNSKELYSVQGYCTGVVKTNKGSWYDFIYYDYMLREIRCDTLLGSPAIEKRHIAKDDYVQLIVVSKKNRLKLLDVM